MKRMKSILIIIIMILPIFFIDIANAEPEKDLEYKSNECNNCLNNHSLIPKMANESNSIIQNNVQKIEHKTDFKKFKLNDKFSPLRSTRMSKYQSHLITYEEIKELKRKIGVRDPNKNYNDIVDGHGTGLAPPTEDEWSEMVGTLEVVTGTESLDLPSSIDHSASTYFPKVGDQGNQGSCAAWATNYYINGYLQAKDNDWTQASSGVKSQLMSPAWTYNKVNRGYGSGSTFWKNYKILESIGSATLTKMNYNEYDPVSWGNESAWREAPKYRVNDYYSTSPQDIDVIRSWLNDGYLCYFGIDAGEYSSCLGLFDNIIRASEYDSTTSNHANTIVGYDDDITAVGEIGAFKIVNSWGSSFGSSGFFWMTYKAFAELLDNVYILNDKVDYNPSLLATWNFTGNCSRDSYIYIGLGNISNPIDTRDWYQNAGNHNYPSFMCLDISEFEYYIGFEPIYLKIFSGTNKTSISSFKLELYEDGYINKNPTVISEESPDVPQSIPGTVNNTIFRLIVKINSPNENCYYNEILQSNGTVDKYITETILFEDFENDFTYDWYVWDINSSEGYDYWGESTYRAKSGFRSGWCAGVKEPVFEEDFDTWGIIPTSWKTYSAGTNKHPWSIINSGYDFVYGGDDYGAICDSDAAGSGTEIKEWLYTNVSFNASDYSSLYLEFFLDYQYYSGNEYFKVLISNGSSYPNFTTIKTWQSDTTGKQTVDISDGAGENEVYIAFIYNASFDHYVFIDDVRITPFTWANVYDDGMCSYMYQPVSLKDYEMVNLTYDYWLESEKDYDFFYVFYYQNGTIYNVSSYNGSNKFWKSGFALIPNNATYIGFIFTSDYSISFYEGVYVDNIKLTGYKNLSSVEYKLDSDNWRSTYGKSDWNCTINTTRYSDGEHNLTIRAKFGLNYTYDNAQIYFDNTHPNSFNPTANPSTWTSNTQPVIYFSTIDINSGIDFYELKIDDGAFTKQVSPFLLPSQADGIHNITVRAYDKVNNSVDGYVNVYIDTTPPNAFTPISDPSNWTSNTQPEISFSTTDSMSGIDYYEVKIDGGSYSIQSSPYKLPNQFDGEHKITVRAYDKALNYYEAIVRIYIDSSNPKTFAPTAEPNSWTSNTQPVISFSTIDEITEIDYYEVKIDTGLFTGQTSPYTLPPLSDGIHKITVRAYDKVGNYVDGFVNVYIDTTPPKHFKPASDLSGWTINTDTEITFSTTDTTSGIDFYKMKLDDNVFSDAIESPYSLSGLNNGKHNITIRAYDLAGNYYDGYVNIYIDTLKPNFFTPTVKSFGWTSNPQPIITFITNDSISAIDYYKVKIDNSDFTLQTSPYKLPNLTNGKHIIIIRAFDLAGNFREGSVEVLIDTDIPDGEINTPANNSWFGKEGFIVSWIGTDLTSGIDNYILELDGTIVLNNSKTRYHEIKDLREGGHTIKLKIIDKADNQFVDEIKINIDLTPPELRIENIYSDKIFIDNDIFIRWESMDKGSGIDYHELKIDDGEFVNVGMKTGYTSGKLSEGEHNITIKIYDNVGNSNKVTLIFFVDTEHPTVDISLPIEGSTFKNNSINCTWSGFDTCSGMDHYEIKLDSNKYINVGKNTSYVFSELADGAHRIYLKTFDIAGNYDYQTVDFKIKTDQSIKSNGDEDGDDTSIQDTDNSGVIIGIAVVFIIVIMIIIGFLLSRRKKPMKDIKEEKPKSRTSLRKRPQDDFPVLEPEIEKRPCHVRKQRNRQKYHSPKKKQRLSHSKRSRKNNKIQKLESGDEIMWN